MAGESAREAPGTAEVLAQLPVDQWTVFHDLRWPGRRYANVDHVVVGPPGLFVIDSKHWSGIITLHRDVLRQNNRLREDEVVAAGQAAVAVAELVPTLHPSLVRPVLCFVRDEEITGRAGDVLVTSTSTLVPMLLSRPGVLTPDELRQICLDLDLGIRQAVAPPAPAPALTTAGRRTSRGLLAPLVALSLAAALLWAPGVRTTVTDWVNGIISPTVSQEEPEKHPKKHKGEKRRDKPRQAGSSPG